MSEAMVIGLLYLATLIGYGVILSLRRHGEAWRTTLLGPRQGSPPTLLAADMALRASTASYFYALAIQYLSQDPTAALAAVTALITAHSLALLARTAEILGKTLATTAYVHAPSRKRQGRSAL